MVPLVLCFREVLWGLWVLSLQLVQQDPEVQMDQQVLLPPVLLWVLGVLEVQWARCCLAIL